MFNECCYVPILPHRCGHEVTHFFGYDTSTTLPYIKQITLVWYGAQLLAQEGAVEGIRQGSLFIPPFAVFPSECSARLALDEVIILA
jgi:hypothetical protein